MRILAVDLGVARTGLAICDETETLASPLTTICERRDEPRLEKVAQIAREHNAAAIVVGHPHNMDGTCGESAERAKRFADALAEKTGLPVTLWDERLTTVSAIGYLNKTDTR
ncbi:MAG: Holliday junction resolvase RuvX, partial [Clostridia bacterium]|nr:Holliday junction resolvase RuvX [Clostridia bacterium]